MPDKVLDISELEEDLPFELEEVTKFPPDLIRERAGSYERDGRKYVAYKRDDVENFKRYWNSVVTNCTWCAHCQHIDPLHPDVCEAWHMEVTEDMRKSEDCPKWLLDSDIPF